MAGGRRGRARRSPPPAPKRRPVARSIPFRIRPTSRGDWPTLVVHRRRMWEDIGGRTREELDRADPEYLRWIRAETRHGRLFGFLAEAPDGAVLGSGMLWLQPAQPRPGPLRREAMPYILSMFTEPAVRGQGVASALVRAMVDWSERGGYGRIFLHASRLGRPVYAALGFENGNEMRLDLPRTPPRRR